MYDEDYLTHYGVPGMHWGIRRSREDRSIRYERRKLNRKLNKPNNFGPNQNKVLSDRNGALARDIKGSNKWHAAAKAGKGTKEWSEHEQYVRQFSKKYQDQYIDAWAKDNNIKRLSKEGRRYLENKIGFK